MKRLLNNRFVFSLLAATCLALLATVPAEARSIEIVTGDASHYGPLSYTRFSGDGNATLDLGDSFQEIKLIVDSTEQTSNYNWSDPTWSADHPADSHVGGNRSLGAKLIVRDSQGFLQSAVTQTTITVNCEL